MLHVLHCHYHLLSPRTTTSPRHVSPPPPPPPPLPLPTAIGPYSSISPLFAPLIYLSSLPTSISISHLNQSTFDSSLSPYLHYATPYHTPGSTTHARTHTPTRGRADILWLRFHAPLQHTQTHSTRTPEHTHLHQRRRHRILRFPHHPPFFILLHTVSWRPRPYRFSPNFIHTFLWPHRTVRGAFESDCARASAGTYTPRPTTPTSTPALESHNTGSPPLSSHPVDGSTAQAPSARPVTAVSATSDAASTTRHPIKQGHHPRLTRIQLPPSPLSTFHEPLCSSMPSCPRLPHPLHPPKLRPPHRLAAFHCSHTQPPPFPSQASSAASLSISTHPS